MVAEADQEGMLTTAGILADETLEEEVTEVLEAMNVTEEAAPKNTEVENAVEGSEAVNETTPTSEVVVEDETIK
jgi:hypothetical protein